MVDGGSLLSNRLSLLSFKPLVMAYLNVGRQKAQLENTMLQPI
jgi:hypothetical protein